MTSRHLPNVRFHFFGRGGPVNLIFADRKQSYRRRGIGCAYTSIGTKNIGSRRLAGMLLLSQFIEQVSVQAKRHDRGYPISFVLSKLTVDILPVIILRLDRDTVHQTEMRMIG